MKIVFVNYYFHPDPSATSRLLGDLAFHLADSGLDVRVLTSRRRYDDPEAALTPYEAVSCEAAGSVKVYRLWAFGFSRRVLWRRLLDAASFYVAVFFKLYFLLEPGDRVVVKTDPPLVSVFARVAAKAKGAFLINWLQDLFPETARVFGGKEGFFIRSLKKLRNASLNAARANVAIGEDMKASLARQGVGPEKVTVISNWAAGGHIKPVLRSENILRKDWRLQGKFVVGYSGNMGRAHEFQTILDAAESLKDETSFVFLFVGDGPKRGWIEDESRKRGLSNFLFKPYQPEERLSESLSLPDVHWVSLLPDLEDFIVPSKFYGIAAAGRPVIYIGTGRGEIARLVKEADCGDTVTSGDFRKLKERLLRWREDPGRLERMGQSARRHFEEKWDKRFGLAAWKKILT